MDASEEWALQRWSDCIKGDVIFEQRHLQDDCNYLETAGANQH